MENNKIHRTLFFTFLKIGLFTFGGGYAMIPLINSEVVERRNWLTDKEMLEMLAISEATPGPVAINVASFVGYKKAKIKGAICSTLGVSFPSFLIIIIVSFFLNAFSSNIYIQNAFKGIRAGVVVLILSACYKLFKQMDKKVVNYVILVSAIILSLGLSFSTIGIILMGAIVGIVYGLVARRSENFH